MALTSHQQRVFKDMGADITLYLTRVIQLIDLCTRLQDAIEELELEDKALLRSLLECWTTLELIASAGDERASLGKISATLETLRGLITAAS